MQLRAGVLSAMIGLVATATALGNNWTLACGSTCDDLAVVASGDYGDGTQTCDNFSEGYDFCYLDVTETVTYGDLYAWVSQGEDCVGTGAQEATFNAGECSEVTSYQSYIVVLEV